MKAKVIESIDSVEFEKMLNEHFQSGYKIKACNCGFVNDAMYDYCSSYQAVLVREQPTEASE